MSEIIIEGWRAGGEAGKEAASAPDWQLPTLTEEQKSAAKRMGVSEEDYRRTVYAGRLNQKLLIEKTRRFAAILQVKLKSIAPDAFIDRIRLLTIEREYRIDICAQNKKVLFRVAEDMVDDFMEKGFAEVGQKIEHNLETVLFAQAGYNKNG